MTTAIDTVLFDLDGTLVEYERSAADLLSLAFDDVGVDPFFTAAEYYDYFDRVVESGVYVDDIRAHCFAGLASDAGRDPDLGRAVAAAFAAERDHSRVRLLPGARALLDACRAEYRVGMVTNGPPEMQTPKLDGAGIADCFGTIVHAGHDDGVPAKPDPTPFERALDALDATPEGTVHVGNSLPADVTGAHAAGLRSVWVPAEAGVTPDPEPHYSVASLAELDPAPWAAAD